MVVRVHYYYYYYNAASIVVCMSYLIMNSFCFCVHFLVSGIPSLVDDFDSGSRQYVLRIIGMRPPDSFLRRFLVRNCNSQLKERKKERNKEKQEEREKKVLQHSVSLQGGIKAVLWADTVQLLIMISGLLAVAIRGCMEVGGIAEGVEDS